MQLKLAGSKYVIGEAMYPTFITLWSNKKWTLVEIFIDCRCNIMNAVHICIWNDSLSRIFSIHYFFMQYLPLLGTIFRSIWEVILGAILRSDFCSDSGVDLGERFFAAIYLAIFGHFPNLLWLREEKNRSIFLGQTKVIRRNEFDFFLPEWIMSRT